MIKVAQLIESYVSTIDHYWTRFDEYIYRLLFSGEPKEGILSGGEIYSESQNQCDTLNENCDIYKYTKFKGAELKGAFKVPSLRNLKFSPSFMHDGRFKSIEDVINFYINPYSFPIHHTDVKPLRLLHHQRKQLISFLKALNDEYYE